MSIKPKAKGVIAVILSALFILCAAAGLLYLKRSGKLYLIMAQFQKKDIVEIVNASGELLSLENISEEVMKADSRFSFDQSLMLVNTEHMLSDDFTPDIAEYKDTEVIMNCAILESYSALSQSVRENFGEKLYVSSSYRSSKEQAEVIEEVGTETATAVGASEHQTGLALDVYVAYYAGDGFLQSNVGKFVNTECDKFGFIIRYPEGKENVTGIRFEPWHIRYVGEPHARAISGSGMALEEYIDGFVPGEFYEIGDYIVTRQNKGVEYLIPSGGKSFTVSEDNTGCVIITARIN